MPTQTITIPRETLKRADLVLIPRQEYEDLLNTRKRNGGNRNIVMKRSPYFRIPKKHEKFYEKLDKELAESLRDYYRGNYYGPFKTVNEGIAFLKRRGGSQKK